MSFSRSRHPQKTRCSLPVSKREGVFSYSSQIAIAIPPHIGVDGNKEDHSVGYFFERNSEDEEFPPRKDLQAISYDKSWAVDPVPLLTANWYWESGKEHTVTDLQTALTARVNAASTAPSTSATAPSLYGLYIIQGGSGEWSWSVTFGEAKAEKAVVQYRNKWVVGGEEAADPYQDRSVTLVTLRPGSSISIALNPDFDITGVQHDLKQDGDGKYTYRVAATMLFGEDFNMAFLSSDGDDLKNELKTGPVMISTEDEDHIIAYEAAPAPVDTVFSDVPVGAYYADAVDWALDRDITNGTTSTTFSPNETCTTAQILTFLWRACGRPTADIQNPFVNVSPDAYYYQAVLWAAQKGMVTGPTFPADTPCSRAHAVTFIWKSMDCPTPTAAARLTDVAQSAPYAQAVSWAVGADVTNGTTVTTFSPDDTCTRGQIVTFLHRALG